MIVPVVVSLSIKDYLFTLYLERAIASAGLLNKNVKLMINLFTNVRETSADKVVSERRAKILGRVKTKRMVNTPGWISKVAPPEPGTFICGSHANIFEIHSNIFASPQGSVRSARLWRRGGRGCRPRWRGCGRSWAAPGRPSSGCMTGGALISSS